jgi:hypothetical protein
MTLVDDDLDDETHQQMDEHVVVDVKAIFGDKDPHLTHVLTCIVGRSEGKLDARYQQPSNAGALIKEHEPDLTEKLQVAWNNRSFRDIRRLCAFFFPD